MNEPTNIFDVKVNPNFGEEISQEGLISFFNIDKERVNEIRKLTEIYSKQLEYGKNRDKDILVQLLTDAYDIFNYQITDLCRNTTELSFCSAWFGLNVSECAKSFEKAERQQISNTVEEIVKTLMKTLSKDNGDKSSEN